MSTYRFKFKGNLQIALYLPPFLRTSSKNLTSHFPMDLMLCPYVLRTEDSFVSQQNSPCLPGWIFFFFFKN